MRSTPAETRSRRGSAQAEHDGRHLVPDGHRIERVSVQRYLEKPLTKPHRY